MKANNSEVVITNDGAETIYATVMRGFAEGETLLVVTQGDDGARHLKVSPDTLRAILKWYDEG